MIFTRMGSRLLFLRTDSCNMLEEYLIDRLNSRKTTLDDAFQKSSEDSTIVFLTPAGLDKTDAADALSILLTPCSSSNILMRIINDNKAGLLEKAQLGPGLLIMRIPEGGHGIIERMQKEYTASRLSFTDAIGQGESEDTMVLFTTKSINRYVYDNGTGFPILLVNAPIAQMQRNIRRDAVRYITESIPGTQWYEFRINIYDVAGHYMEHLERLMLTLSELEVGFTLGQQWTRDHALVLYSVTAYQVRLFTLLPPHRIKKLLIGLEYNGQNKRFVDMDLYHRNRKIEFSSLDEKTKDEGRAKTAARMREEILSKLSRDTLEKFHSIEQRI